MDERDVEALTRQIHEVDCLPGASPQTVWSQEHHARDQTKATQILTGLDTEGWRLVRKRGPAAIPRKSECPTCGDRVDVVADKYVPHYIRVVRASGTVVTDEVCAGSGVRARPIPELAVRIREQRRTLGWTQADLAVRAKVSRSTVAGLEVGASPGQPDVLVAVIGALACGAARGAP